MRILQLLCQRRVNEATAQQQGAHAGKLLSAIRQGQGAGHLHGHQRGKIHRLGQGRQRGGAWLGRDQVQTAHQRPHHHHLAGNVAQRQTEQGGITRF